jgi:hypothetical protein
VQSSNSTIAGPPNDHLIPTPGASANFHHQRGLYRSRCEGPSWDKWEAIIGWGTEDEAEDTIAKQVDDLIDRVEAFYGRWLMREIPKPSKSH